MTLRRPWLLRFPLPSLLSLVSLLSVSGSALAQGPAAGAAVGSEPTSDQRALAEMLFFTGKGLMGDGRISPACEKFAESYRLDPAAGTLLNLAVCHEKEGKLASSWGEFRQALAEAKRAGRQDRIDLATDAIKRIEPDLPFVSIVVPKEVRVEGLDIQRNGVPLQAAAWNTELPIDPGANEILVSAPLYKLEKKSFSIARRQHMAITLDALDLAPVYTPPPPFWTAQRKLGAGTFVGGVALAAIGGVFGALALGQKSTSDQNCPSQDGQVRCSASGSNAMSSATTDAWVADIGIGVGAAAIVTGSLLYALGGAKVEGSAPPPDAPAPEASAWSLRVVAGARGGQAILARSF